MSFKGDCWTSEAYNREKLKYEENWIWSGRELWIRTFL
jgi:hypothetical protein